MSQSVKQSCAIASGVTDRLNTLDNILKQKSSLQEQIDECSEALILTKSEIQDTRRAVSQLEKRVDASQPKWLVAERHEGPMKSSSLDEIIAKNMCLRDDMVRFSEALVTTNHDLQDVRLAVNELNVARITEESRAGEMQIFFKEMKSWQEGLLKLEAEHEQLLPNLKQYAKSAVAEHVAGLGLDLSRMEGVVTGRVDAFSEHISDMESHWSNLESCMQRAVQGMTNVLDNEVKEREGAVMHLEGQFVVLRDSLEKLDTRFSDDSDLLRKTFEGFDQQVWDRLEHLGKAAEVGRERLQIDLDELRGSIHRSRESDPLCGRTDNSTVHHTASQGEMYDLRAALERLHEEFRISIDDSKEHMATLEQSMAAMKVLWNSVNPESFAPQLEQLRKDLACEVRNRNRALQILVAKMQKEESPNISFSGPSGIEAPALSQAVNRSSSSQSGRNSSSIQMAMGTSIEGPALSQAVNRSSSSQSGRNSSSNTWPWEHGNSGASNQSLRSSCNWNMLQESSIGLGVSSFARTAQHQAAADHGGSAIRPSDILDRRSANFSGSSAPGTGTTFASRTGSTHSSPGQPVSLPISPKRSSSPQPQSKRSSSPQPQYEQYVQPVSLRGSPHSSPGLPISMPISPKERASTPQPRCDQAVLSPKRASTPQPRCDQILLPLSTRDTACSSPGRVSTVSSIPVTPSSPLSPKLSPKRSLAGYM